MSRITYESKCRLCRAEGSKLLLKGDRCLSAKCPIEKKGAVKPGMHGLRGSKKPTDYGIQLRAKQKAKRLYGVQETQFHNLYQVAKNMKGLVGDNFMVLLERRLDNAIYLAGLSASRSAAKQIISHKHILVNGSKVNISSYLLKVGDEVSLDQKIIEKQKETLPVSDSDFKAPSWLDLNKKEFSAKVVSLPDHQEINRGIDVNLIVEYYSR